MKYSVGKGTIELLLGDITTQQVDAIVNAANTGLSAGSGIDGAIHRQGGSKILEDTRKRYPMGCQTGRAVVSVPGQLHCKVVIHAVGPIWHNGSSHESELLEQAYLKSLEAAYENECETIAFPALSCGAYAFPLEPAAEIAFRTMKTWLEKGHPPLTIRFVFFSETAFDAFAKVAGKILECPKTANTEPV
jgi:O-acetyl-ADP-ribose deacetylase (regulator of RNase III)